MGKSEFQTLAYTAKLAGMEESRLVMTMNNLNLRTIEACDGNKSYQESFKRLGISLQEFATLSPDKKIEALGNAYKKSGESLTALNDISTILGQKTGAQMLEVLDKVSTEGMGKLTQASIEAGHDGHYSKFSSGSFGVGYRFGCRFGKICSEYSGRKAKRQQIDRRAIYFEGY